MPTYLLHHNENARIHNGDLQLSAREARTGRPVPLRIETDGGPAPTPFHQRPELTVLPAPTRRTLVRATPAAETFADGTAVTLRLWTDADEIVLSEVDVSGLARPELLMLTPDGSGLAVAAVRTLVEDPAVGLAARARSVARTVLGRAQSDRALSGGAGPAAERPTELLVGVDVSASMRPALADGSVAALLDTMVGLSFVVGRPGRVRVGLLGRRPSWLAEQPGGSLAAAATAEIDRTGLGCGFRAATAPVPAEVDGPAVLFLITDAPPADVDDLAAATARDGLRRHLVLVGHPTASVLPPGVEGTVLAPPPRGESTTAHLLRPAAAETLTSLVASLLTPWTAGPPPVHADPGTETF